MLGSVRNAIQELRATLHLRFNEAFFGVSASADAGCNESMFWCSICSDKSAAQTIIEHPRVPRE